MAATDLATGSARPDTAGRRTRLRQYQVQLLERMQAARTNTGARINQLGVMIGPNRYLLDLTQAGEIVPVPPLTAVPLTQPWYLGLANIRGNLIGIVDLARYLGEGETKLGPESRIVTFASGLGFNCALLVSRVFGLRHAGDMQVEGERLRDADNIEWAPLDLAALVGDERFLHVGY
ncbi:MAG: chemotaxis protein CheW [Massilia sp.]|nr:chemotaxis protein CheW [Massilia sp.]